NAISSLRVSETRTGRFTVHAATAVAALINPRETAYPQIPRQLDELRPGLAQPVCPAQSRSCSGRLQDFGSRYGAESFASHREWQGKFESPCKSEPDPRSSGFPG